MPKINRNYKRLSVWILLFTQVLLIMSYFYLRVDSDVLDNHKITFVESHEVDAPRITYHTSNSKIFLKSINSRTKFMDFNSSLCYINGTDLVSMERTKDTWRCHCLPGWHGKDCGQPEIIWRAFLTHRKPIKISGPRSFERRIIYIFAVDKFSETTVEIRINELGDIVDLFVLCEDETSDFIQNKLNNNFMKKFQKKILYVRADQTLKALKAIKNLRDDDVILTSRNFDIPNKFAINFLKFYNKWPEPVAFRLRWSVFGYFWVHPERTVTAGGACSVAYLRKTLGNSIHLLVRNTSGIILGDLNHYGGWYCEYCFDMEKILEFLAASHVNLEAINRKKIDSGFLEDVIENGLYIDGKTELARTHRYRDSYFAPYHVLDNNWNYDFLLTNFYSKIDYYEG